MPRVHTRVKSPRGRTFRCTGCGEEIKPGEQFFTWAKRNGGQRCRHTSCGFPRPSELSGRKTAIVEDAIQAAGDRISNWTPELDESPEGELSYSAGYEDVSAELSSVADEAEGVADEYESSADNMPESLQYGQQAEAMRDVAERLREWAQELRDWEPSSSEPDFPEAEEQDADEFRDECETALSDWADDVRSEATDQMAELPEYEG